jgi:transposase
LLRLTPIVHLRSVSKIEVKSAEVAANVAATMAATDAEASPRIEIVGDRRRAHDATFRARVVAESMSPGARIQDLARRHGVCASLIYRWRREASPQVGRASAVQLVPVQVSDGGESGRRAAASGGATKPRSTGIIEIELEGGVRIRVSGEVSLPALRRVVAAIRG